MVIKNFIDKLRSKGYDDLYLADLAHKWDGALMLGFFLYSITHSVWDRFPAWKSLGPTIPSWILVGSRCFSRIFVLRYSRRGNQRVQGKRRNRPSLLLHYWLSHQ